MQLLDETLTQVVPAFDAGSAETPFEQLGMDSFDMVVLRVELEKKLGRIPDDAWVTFRSCGDIRNHFAGRREAAGGTARSRTQEHERRVRVNMPEMALEGLSESWLFKALGDMHWSMICDALGRSSHDLTDELGNRLYATFVRLRVKGAAPLRTVGENEELVFRGRLSRYGASVFFSDITIAWAGRESVARLMTTFATRQSNNKSLLKGEPALPPQCGVAASSEMPDFGRAYKGVRRGELDELTLDGETFPVDARPLGETAYELNPYHDFNGVNLLYFAAYPIISDACERVLIHERPDIHRVARDWALEASVVSRDVFYCGNCDIEDAILYRMTCFEPLPDRRVKIASSLHRRNDGELIARLFTIKRIHG